MYVLKLTQVGESLGVIFPTELLSKLKLQEGDEIFLTDSPSGMHLHLPNTEIGIQLRMGRDIMEKYRAVLQALAK